MKLKPVKRVPVLIALGIILLVCGLRLLRIDFLEGIERMTYDIRVRQALKFNPPIATNLGFVFIDEPSIDFVRNNRVLGYNFGLYWPRQIYGRLIHELAEEGARAVAFDVIFRELRPDHPPIKMADDSLVDSDEFFAEQIRRAGNVILAAPGDITMPELFLTNALALGDISTSKDPDGVLRRTAAFLAYRRWHPAFKQAETQLGFDLQHAQVESRQIVLSRADGETVKVPLDRDGCFDLRDFLGDSLPPGSVPLARPFTEEKVWNMGLVLAARELNLDLAHAEVDLQRGRIVLRGPGGVQRVIPVDSEGEFYIDWSMPPNHPQLTRQRVSELLLKDRARLEPKTNEVAKTSTDDSQPSGLWRDKLIVIGSSAVGNDLTDRGATPLGPDTLLVSKHWNVANSILTGRFVRRASLPADLLLIALAGIVAGFITWQMRVLLASAFLAGLSCIYVTLAVLLYVRTRYWMPLVLPLFGGALMTYVSLVAWRVVFEQAQVRRIKSIFSEVVSPQIMKELLHVEKLALGGARREVTVLFADVRGFTEWTDATQERAAEFVRNNSLRGEAAEACFDEEARETLNTVNLYLGIVADIILKQDGILDKYIGDCVMAFWGAPTPNPRHASACVRTAIEAQRAIHDLNQQRAAENKRRELENRARLSAGLKAKPTLPLLVLGTGINTGMATAGLMGSKSKQKNYTVFGREVNLASRLEGLSGHGRIFISSGTYSHLQRTDPSLAATCISQGQKSVKGIAGMIEVYEVPWKPTGTQFFEALATPAVPASAGSSTVAAI